MSGRAWRLLLLAGLAAFLGEFDGATLPLALPAISTEFGAPLAALSNLGSLLLLGGLLALPMAVLADRRGRRHLVAIGVLGFSLADLASAFATGIPMLAACRFVAVAFEVVEGESVGVGLEEPAGHSSNMTLGKGNFNDSNFNQTATSKGQLQIPEGGP